ncbi:hypothetical protein [Asanoa siamensis]|uniref:hypothetical protein n=1 Tax=Asanoa siamensis TaxID=926357 RepID=UPI0019404D79|nr:hypothetical protein [Asanoa siamensis]
MIPVAVAAALLAGCGAKDDGGATPAAAATSASPTAAAGIADKPADEILADSRAAIKEAKSYRLKGSLVEEGETITMDLKLNGNEVMGKVSVGKDQGTVEILAVDGLQFIRPDAKFWTVNAGGEAGKTLVQMMGKKWAKISAKDQDLSDLFALANLDELLDAGGTVTKGETKQVNGVEAIALLDGGSTKDKLWIATTGEPYPVLLESETEGGSLAFSDFGKDQGIKAPAAKDVVDFDKLTGN